VQPGQLHQAEKVAQPLCSFPMGSVDRYSLSLGDLSRSHCIALTALPLNRSSVLGAGLCELSGLASGSGCTSERLRDAHPVLGRCADDGERSVAKVTALRDREAEI
jgi:hypothetical protein